MADFKSLLTPAFPAKHVAAAVEHLAGATESFGHSEWERCIAKAGKFVEAILKAVGTHCNVPFETGRKFKADRIMNGLGNLPDGSFDDSLRLGVPRACRVVYDIASNRGARHDPHEVNPNAMDAGLVVPVCSWILAELIRFAQKGAVDPSEAAELVEALMERRYPAVEVIGDRIYLHAKKKSAADVILVALARRHPKRMSKEQLIATAVRNGFSKNNANMAVARIKKFVDRDEDEMMRLLVPGLRRAEEIISVAIKTPA
jgi:predicted nucleic acid-binding protein